MVVSEAMARPRRRLTREDWAAAALAAIAEGGLSAVAVEPLAARLGTTKGSFYWHFANRDALLEAALSVWEATTTTEVLSRVEAQADPREQLRLLIAVVTEMAERDPVGLALLPHGAHAIVGPALERVTRTRLENLVRIFTTLGFRPAMARQRATLAYSAYLGHAQLAHSTPGVLPAGKAARRAYLDHAVETLTGRPERPGAHPR